MSSVCAERMTFSPWSRHCRGREYQLSMCCFIQTQMKLTFQRMQIS